MHAFSGAILGSEHDAALPTVAQIDGDSLILSSSQGLVAAWPLDRVQIIEVGNGHFQVVAEDRTLSLVVDQPEAFEEALEAERAGRSRPVDVARDEPEVHEVQRLKTARRRRAGESRRRRSGFVSGGPRHGPARVRVLPFIVTLAAVASIGSLAGSFIGDVVQKVTTDDPGTEIPSSEVTVRSFHGVADEVTSAFTVQSPWEIRWLYEGPRDARFEVLIITEDDAGSAVAVQQGPGSGTVTSDRTGTYRLETKSTSRGEWTISVVQLAGAPSD
jgi:hypothetical protein